MPDNEDYSELDRLLASPASWTDADAAFMRSLVRNQAVAIADCHPRDTERRQSMEKVQVQLIEAVAQWEAAR